MMGVKRVLLKNNKKKSSYTTAIFWDYYVIDTFENSYLVPSSCSGHIQCTASKTAVAAGVVV